MSFDVAKFDVTRFDVVDAPLIFRIEHKVGKLDKRFDANKQKTSFSKGPECQSTKDKFCLFMKSNIQ